MDEAEWVARTLATLDQEAGPPPWRDAGPGSEEGITPMSKTRRPRRYEVNFVNSYGRIVRTVNFRHDELGEAREYQRKHAYDEPAARGATVWLDSDGYDQAESSGLLD